MQLRIAMNNEHFVWSDDAMPTLRNVHNRITLLIHRQLISS